MPVYEYRCPQCGQAYAARRRLGDTQPPACPTCEIPTRRRYTPIAIRNSMPEHFNTSVGTFVSNEQQFKDQLKVQSEIATLRTGLEHNFVPHDPRESKEALNVTEEGLEATYRKRRELGLPTGEEVRSLSGKRKHIEEPEAVLSPIAADDEDVQWLE